MFHYALPPACTPAAAAAVNDVVRAWHLSPGRYDMEADIKARDDKPEVQHLALLYRVRGAAWRRCAVRRDCAVLCGVAALSSAAWLCCIVRRVGTA